MDELWADGLILPFKFRYDPGGLECNGTMAQSQTLAVNHRHLPNHYHRDPKNSGRTFFVPWRARSRL
jgi:hypothetical protein